MMTCDSADAPKRIRMYSHGSNVGKVLGNVIGMLAKNHLFFIPVLTPTPPPPPPTQTQIDFESRLGAHDVLNDCTMAVDGTVSASHMREL